MIFNPKRYQTIAAEFLAAHPRCALFLDMGLGKTVVTLGHIDRLIYQEFSARKALVLAPKSVAEDTWTRECAKWDHLQHLRVEKVMGTAKQRIAALERDADIYVTNRENTIWLCEYLDGQWPFDVVVIDELSSFKASNSKRWRCLKKVIAQSDAVIGLTGTPASNGYEDLWAEIYLIDGGERLGRTISAYRLKYFNVGAHKGHIVYEYRLKPGAKNIIDTRLSDICLSMSKEDWLELPPMQSLEVYVHMSKTERKIYDEFQREHIIPLLDGKLSAVDDAESAVLGETAATVSNKLLQMANGNVYDDTGAVFHLHDRKLDALRDIAEAANGDPLLVFYSYRHDLAAIKAAFPDALELKDGDLSANISKWNSGSVPMLLAHPASAGHGLNLQQGGHIIVWYGLTWSLELYQQANARLFRQGQEKKVMVYHILTANTVDERVVRALNSKDATQRGLLDALKNYLAEEARV